jgi:serine/threonine protein kinase/lipopolysaccharide biosynthesis regulator YciM
LDNGKSVAGAGSQEMKENDWKKVEEIFHSTLDVPLGERKTYLQKVCAGDDRLFSEIESLIESLEKNSDFLDEPVLEIALSALHKNGQKKLTGTTIGFYELHEKIGAGGMGEVYKAFDTRLSRRVALKFLSELVEDGPAAKRQLVKEAQAAAALEHPNICSVYGFEQTDKHHFIVMQYIEGKTLSETIGKENIGVEEFKSLARQIVTAVAFAHSHGIIHRDLKPGNIMLTPEGQIKILDFGLAKVVHQKQNSNAATDSRGNFSQNGLIIGTVSYMAPEQLRGEKVDYRTDIFSVGIILYELLAQKNPFNRKSQAETIAAILGDEPSTLEKLKPDFPIRLIKLVEKCLKKDPEKRFQSAAEILVELDKTDSKNYREKASKLWRRFFVKAALAVVVLVSVFAFGLYLYSGKRSQKAIAVMPILFNNAPLDKEYLADGLTQSIIERLSNLSDLKVKNQYVITGFKKTVIEPQIAGKALNVDAVFVSSIIQRSDLLVLTAKLIRTSDGFIIDEYESEINEARLIELEEGISARIISKIKSNLTDEDKHKLDKKDTESEDAKRLYLSGRNYLNRREGDDLQNAIRLFTEATIKDINYAKAWTGLADAYLYRSLAGNKDPMPPKEAIKAAKSAAKTALDLDKTLCETYNSLGMINLKYDWKWNEAESYFRIAINCDSEFLPARANLISVLQINGRFDEALQEAQKAKEIDPLAISFDLLLASANYGKRDYEQMDKVLSDLLKRYPPNNRISYARSYYFLQTGRFDKVIEILEKIYNSGKDSDRILVSAPLGFAYAKSGQHSEALEIIDNLELLEKNNYVPAQEKAIIYVALGNLDKGFENLKKSCDERYSSFPGIIHSPLLEEIKSDVRFVELRKCANL